MQCTAYKNTDHQCKNPVAICIEWNNNKEYSCEEHKEYLLEAVDRSENASRIFSN